MFWLESIVLRNLPFLTGGIIIGIAASGLLWIHGRIAGISGIIAGLLPPFSRIEPWRVAFSLGLLTSGLIAFNLDPNTIGIPPDNRPLATLGIAGLLVGFGTGLSGGCTSGHGICGLARRSLRSVIATVTFMASGIVTATAYAYFVATP
jgi:uncharacterized membrane protein YedE/YeeE